MGGLILLAGVYSVQAVCLGFLARRGGRNEGEYSRQWWVGIEMLGET